MVRTPLHLGSDGTAITLVESFATSADAIPDCYDSEGHHGLSIIPLWSHLDLKEKQREGTTICEVIFQMECGEKIPPTVRKELPDLPLLLGEWNKLQLRDDVLYRRRQDGEQVIYQLVLLSMVLQSLHNDMGHMGIERTLDLVRTHFYWPRMAADVEHKVKICERCVRRKSPPERAAPLVNIRANPVRSESDNISLGGW